MTDTITKREIPTVAGKYRRIRAALALYGDVADITALRIAVDDAVRCAVGTREGVGTAALQILTMALASAGVDLTTDRFDPDLIARLNTICSQPLDPVVQRRVVDILNHVTATGAVTGPVVDFQYGYDGHALTREGAARLGLVRYFESATSAFADLLRRSFTFLARQGVAYTAWTRHVPLLLCDLRDARHVACARAMTDYANNDIVIVTPEYPAAIRAKQQARGDKAWMVVEDTTGLMKSLVGVDGEALLVERRVGGWCVTIPVGTDNRRALQDARLPAAFRALARTAVPCSYLLDERPSKAKTTKDAAAADPREADDPDAKDTV